MLAQQQLPVRRVLTFFGQINPPNTNSLRAALCAMVNEGAKEITILFASPGGSTDDGMALFTYLRALPVTLTMHAVGFVSSVAIPVFLSAPNRLASENARFFFHDFTWTFPTNIVSRTSAVESSLLMDSALDWTRGVLKSTTKLTDKDLESLRLLQEPCLMSASDALSRGIVQNISEPMIEANTQPRIVAQILDKFIAESGLREVRKIPGYHDEPLQGKRLGERSIRLSKGYRAIYIIKQDGSVEVVMVMEINKHDY